MLVLSRKLMERIIIDGGISITVVRLEGNQVRLGIEAPRNISVVRAELLPDGGAALLEAAHNKGRTEQKPLATPARKPNVGDNQQDQQPRASAPAKPGQPPARQPEPYYPFAKHKDQCTERTDDSRFAKASL